eukprot:COSAG02_NODE_23068_length_731_cov_1.060127_2_plen_162_part_01
MQHSLLLFRCQILQYCIFGNYNLLIYPVMGTPIHLRTQPSAFISWRWIDRYGNLREYQKHLSDEAKALQRCTLGQHFASAGSLKTFKVLTGGRGKLLRQEFDRETSQSKLGYCPDRVRGYASKLSAVCDDVSLHGDKTLVLVHSRHGFKLILRLLNARFPDD